jgi:biopolymer transport protein TolQ
LVNPAYWKPLLADVNFWELVKTGEPVPLTVMLLLLLFSLTSVTIILAKWKQLRGAENWNIQFLRAFRKAGRMDAIAAAVEQFRAAPLATVFEFGYEELTRQTAQRGTIRNPMAIERSLQIGISEEIGRMERSMQWLATTATVTPFIGLFGTVWGIIDAFQALGLTGSTSMRTVAPGIAHALVTTALGLVAAIPAAVFYNYLGNIVKQIGARMEDFSLEFLNLAERDLEK